MKNFGFTELQVLLVEIPRSGTFPPDPSLLSSFPLTTSPVTSVLIFVAVGFYTRRFANARLYIMALACIPPFVGLLAMSLLPNSPEYRWTKWGLYFITVPFVLALFLAWTLSTYFLFPLVLSNLHRVSRTALANIPSLTVPSNIAGRTKKTIISSATFVGYCVGNMCGSQIFKSKDAPRYVPGTIGACACLGLEFLLICTWRMYYVAQNKKRGREAAASGLSAAEQERLGREMGEKNATDLENRWFRYTL